MGIKHWWSAFWGDPYKDRIVLTRLTWYKVYLLLKWSQVALRALFCAHMLMLVLWCVGSIVPGFAFYDGTPGRFNAISHLGFWLAIEFFVLFIGALSISFGISTIENGLALDALRTIHMMGFFFGMLFVAIAANITHLVACGMELADGTSTLATQEYGFLIALIVILSIVLVMEVVELIYVGYYRQHLRWARHFRKEILDEIRGIKAPTQTNQKTRKLRRRI